MEDSPSGMDPAGLAEAPELVGAVSQAMEDLAAQIQSRDGKWVLRSCPRKLVGPELELLRVYMLKIWFISAGAGDKALALQAREATYFIDDLQDLILHCCTLARRAKIFSHQFKVLPAVWFCWNRMLGVIAPKPPRKIMKDIKVVNTETRRIGNLLEKVADPSSTSVLLLTPPDSGREILQEKAKVFGRDKERDEIAQMLINPRGNAAAPDIMVSIVGAGGIGKTTLAQTVFDDAKVSQHFDVRCWVSVSSSFNLMKLTADILNSAQPSWNGSAEKMVDLQMIQSELRRFVTSKSLQISGAEFW